MAYVTNNFDEHVVELLKDGGVGFVPSDTIYGLSGRALDQRAVEKIHSLKDRSEHKPFIILISELKMLDMLSIEQTNVGLLQQYWPGPVTFILDSPHAPVWLHKGLQSLAVRMPANPELKVLIDKVGPIISTSANIERQPPANSLAAAKDIFGEQLDFYVDHGQINGSPSTLVKIAGGKIDVIREGAVKITARGYNDDI